MVPHLIPNSEAFRKSSSGQLCKWTVAEVSFVGLQSVDHIYFVLSTCVLEEARGEKEESGWKSREKYLLMEDMKRKKQWQSEENKRGK